MADIGEATIRIVADSSAFQNTLSRIGRADGIGRQFGERLGETASRWLRRGLVTGAAGIATVVGATLLKGFRRFTTIEDATASLTLQLQDAGKAAGLLQDVLEVVEGTPFALDQFVDAARNLVAASIPLEKVPGILEAVADAAAAAGGSAEDVDNVVNAIGRLATGAELTLGPIRDLEELGVPALRILANQAGKSTQEMADDISGGVVDSRKAIDDLVEGLIKGTDGINGATVAFGGAAKNVGNTVSGAFANMRIAIDRAGAKILDVFAGAGEGGNALVTILNDVRDTIDILGDQAVVASRRIVGSDGFAQVLEFFEKLPQRVKTKGLVKGVLEGIREGFDRAPKDLLGSVISTIIIRGVEATARFTPQIVAAVIAVAPQIIGGVVTGLVQAAKDNPLDMALFLGALGIPGVGTAIAGFFSRLPFGSIIAPLIRGIGFAMQRGFLFLASPAFLGFLGSVASSIGTTFMAALGGAISGPAIAALLGVALGFGINRFIEKFFPEVNRALEDGGAAIFDFFVDHFFPFFTQTIPDFFTETIPRIIGQVVDFFAALPGKVLEGIANGFVAVFEWFAGLGERIVNTVGNIWDAFYSIGRNLLVSLKNGAVSVYDEVFGFFEDLGGDIYDAVAGALDIFSPSRKFRFIGEQIVAGLKLGVEGSKPALDRVMAGLVAPRLDAAAIPSSASGRAPMVNNWTITEAFGPRETAEQVINRLAVG